MEKKQNTVTLFSVIESMQRKLENQGMDPEHADVAITRQVRALLAGRRHGSQVLTTIQ